MNAPATQVIGTRPTGNEQFVAPSPDGDAANIWLPRFTYTERVLHWVNSLAFLVLAVTGLGIYIHALEDAANHLLVRLPGFFPRLELVDIHIAAAILFILNPLLSIVLGNRRALLANARDILHFDADDRAWLARIVTFRRPLPPQGRFNAGQKLSAIGLVLAWGCFLVTGLMQMDWPPFVHHAFGGAPGAGGAATPPGAGGPGPREHATGPFGVFHFSMSALHTVNTVHALLALACVCWLAAHIYLSTVNRGTRHSLWGMTTGRVRRDWARAHHAKWAAVVEERSSGPSETGSAYDRRSPGEPSFSGTNGRGGVR